MAYSKTTWQNLPNTTTPINATNLNKIENGIYDVLLAVYPVGSIYMSVNSTNPGTLFGGTWVAWGSGRVPVGINTSDTDFNTSEKTGGSKTHTLTVDEMPSHTHGMKYGYGSGSSDTYNALVPNKNITQTVAGTEILATGGGQAHSIVQPYITCYMWKRTA